MSASPDTAHVSFMTGASRRNLWPALIGLVLFLAALEVLRTEWRAATWHALLAELTNIPSWRLGIAVMLTAINYGLLTLYDFLALAYVGKRLPWQRVVMTSFIAYAIANNVGFAMLSGTSVRYRFYTRWGVTGRELSRIVFSYAVSFWLGLLFIGGLSFAASSLPGELGPSASAIAAPAGWLAMLASVGYVIASAWRLGPLRIHRLELPLPPARLAIAQFGISVLDWTVAGTVLHVLLPPHSVPFLVLMGAFLASQLIGLTSHVPGGVGVFEGLMVLLLKPFIASTALLPALIVYRAVYYLLPLSIAALGLAADELHQRTSGSTR